MLPLQLHRQEASVRVVSRLLCWISTIALLCMLTSCYDPNTPGTPQSGEVSIAHLKSLCQGDSCNITHDYTISGTVIANDWLGELHKSVVVADDTAGIEIAIESNNLSAWLPIYSKVTIFCNGLTLARVGGKIELGTPPTQTFMLDNIDETLARKIIIPIGEDRDYAPDKRTIDKIALSDISNAVWIERVHIVEAEVGLSWCDSEDGKPITTTRHIEDENGHTLAIRTLGTCRYGNETLPVGTFSVVGIIDYSGGSYLLRIINKSIR